MQFREKKRAIVASGKPVRGDDLLGMVMDLDYGLEDTGILTKVQIKRTGDPQCMVEITCRSTSPAQVVTKELRTIWMDSLRYSGPEAHDVHVADSRVSFEFASASAPERDGGAMSDVIVVTGRILVSCGSEA